MISSQCNNPKNVLMVLVDSLYVNQMGYFGYQPTPTPTLDGLFESGTCFSNYHSVGCPTQFAMPGIFTSTLPLDKGGCELGIRNRDSSLAQVLKLAGFNTSAFGSGFFWDKLYSYDKGFDDYYCLFDILLYQPGLENVYLRYYRELMKDGRLCVEETAELFSLFIGELLKAMKAYCEEKGKELENRDILLSHNIHSWDFSQLFETIANEEDAFLQDPVTYAKNILVGKINFSKIIFNTVLKI